MIPILFKQSETEFSSNGLGRLTDCLSCVVTEERNGIFECEFSYPIAGRHYKDILLGRIIYATHDDTKTPQPFDIYKRSATIDGVVTFYARHIAYRLANVVLRPFTAESCAQTVAKLVENSINDNPFTFWTEKSATATYKLEYPRSVWEILGGSEGSILDVYGKGTYQFDRWTVKLYLNRGRKTDVQIRYGKNLTELQQESDGGDAYNAVVPFWKSSEGDTVVTLPEWVVVAPGVIDPEYLETETPEVVTTHTGEPIEVKPAGKLLPVPLDLSEAFETQPTQEQLRAAALKRLEDGKPWELGENLKINFAELWQTPEYAALAPLERVGLCDTVNVYFSALGVMARDMQIIKTEYNTLLDRYNGMELGQPTVSLASLIRRDTLATIKRQVPTSSQMQEAIDKATQLITGGIGGHVVLATDGDGKPNEILIMDTEDISTAVKVLRINQNGIGFSSTGYNGPFRTAWTLDGSFVADFINTGTLKSDVINVDELFAKTINAKVIDILNGTYYTEDDAYDPDEPLDSEGFGRLRLFTYTDSRGNTAYKIAIECGTSYDSDDESYGSARFIFDSTKGLIIKTGGYSSVAEAGINCDGNVSCYSLTVREDMSCKEVQITDLYVTKMNGRPVPELESGRVTVTASAATAGSVHIDFGAEFDSTPAITVTPHASAPQNVHLGVANTSATGFDLTYWRSSAGTMTVSWIACG